MMSKARAYHEGVVRPCQSLRADTLSFSYGRADASSGASGGREFSKTMSARSPSIFRDSESLTMCKI